MLVAVVWHSQITEILPSLLHFVLFTSLIVVCIKHILRYVRTITHNVFWYLVIEVMSNPSSSQCMRANT